MMFDNVRQHTRRAVEVSSSILVEDEPPIAAMTRDIGLGGICLVCDRALPAGLRFTAGLALAVGAGTFSELLYLPARVVWCTTVGTSYQVGAAFRRLEPQQLAHLEMFLRFIDRGQRAEPTIESQFDVGGEDDS